jgi:hypothetical protein
MRTVHAITISLCWVLPACAIHPFGDDDDDEPRCDWTQEEIDPRGDQRRYVVDVVDLAQGSYADAQASGLDLDSYADGSVDNQLGLVAGLIGLYGDYDLDVEAKALIDAGAILHLLDIQATSLADANGAAVRVFHGVDFDGDPSDNFSGFEPFGIDLGRGDGLATGTIRNGWMRAGPGTAPIAVTFPGLDEPFILPLEGVRIAATITADEIEGILGGAIRTDAIETSVVPTLHAGLLRIVARDCGDGSCESGSFGAALISLFDADGDGAISLAEFRDDELTRGLLAPDVDLDCDDGSDSLSVGMRFHAVRATW